MAEFVEWPKTKRLYRMITVTEKIDGTNSGIHIERVGEFPIPRELGPQRDDVVLCGNDYFRLTAQSRNRLIYPGKGTDNFGFAAWVRDNGTRLVGLLGEGLHMGEWWGSGINRGYGLVSGIHRFSLFNTDRYGHIDTHIGDVHVDSVPLLYQGMFRDRMILAALADLAEHGSKASPGFMNPEGVIVFHSQTRSNFKVTLDNQDASKWEGGQP